jgi:hypothetical protein
MTQLMMVLELSAEVPQLGWRYQHLDGHLSTNHPKVESSRLRQHLQQKQREAPLPILAGKILGGQVLVGIAT